MSRGRAGRRPIRRILSILPDWWDCVNCRIVTTNGTYPPVAEQGAASWQEITPGGDLVKWEQTTFALRPIYNTVDLGQPNLRFTGGRYFTLPASEFQRTVVLVGRFDDINGVHVMLTQDSNEPDYTGPAFVVTM